MFFLFLTTPNLNYVNMYVDIDINLYEHVDIKKNVPTTVFLFRESMIQSKTCMVKLSCWPTFHQDIQIMGSRLDEY